jgi:hypothetical protein
MDKLTVEDWVAISDHMGDYCWKVDSGDGDAWAALWTADGVFTGVTPEPIVGHESLREVPIKAFNDFGQGKMRHLFGNMTCRYGSTRDVVNAKFYNQIAVWGGIPQAGNFCIALCEAVFVRNGDGWLIKRNDAVLMEA